MASLIENDVKNAYPNGKCPDCLMEIPDDVHDGDECQNCGHVFYSYFVDVLDI
jgi:hypothetical protein